MSVNGNDEWFCYIKPRRYVHSSGFRIFEVGYCQIGEDNRVTKKVVLGVRSDVIHFYDVMEYTPKDTPKYIHIDLTRDGYIRFFSRRESISWRRPVFSDAMLVSRPIDQEECNIMWESQNKEREL